MKNNLPLIIAIILLAIGCLCLGLIAKEEKARMNELIEWTESINNRLKVAEENVTDVFKWGVIQDKADTIQNVAPFPFPPIIWECY